MYGSLFYNDTLVVLVVDPLESTIIDANPAATVFYGFTREQMAGLPLSRIQGSHGGCSHRIADGSRRTVDIRTIPTQLDGRAIEFWVIYDLTVCAEKGRSQSVEAQIWRVMMEHSRDGIVVLDSRGGVFGANKAFARMIGYSLDEVYDLHVWDWESVSQRAQVEVMLDDLDEAGHHFETRHIRKDRSVYDVEIATTGVVLEGEKYVFCICRDITERKAAEAEFAHRHDLMRYIIEHDSAGVAVHDRDLNYIYVSRHYLEQYEVREEDVIGRNHYDVFPDLPQKWRDVHRRALAGEVCSCTEDPYIRPDGDVSWTDWECRPWYERDGSVGGIIVYTEVVNERREAEQALRESEERLRALSDNIPDGFVYRMETAAPGGLQRFVYVSAGVEHLHEVPVEQVLSDASALYGQVMPEYRDAVERLQRQASHDGARVAIELRYRTPSGAIKWSRIAHEAREVGDGVLVWDGVEIDITDHKEAELELARHRDQLEALVSERTAELERTNEELTQASRAKSSFLANMSHELRTPLNSIIGFSDVLLRGIAGELGDRQHAQIEMIHRSGMHLLSLINEVLDLSKIESGRVSLEVSVFDAADLVRDVLGSFETQAADKGLLLGQVGPGAAVMLRSDAMKLRQVLLNLVGNAVKFTDTGSIEVWLGPRTGGGVEIRVSDTGRGIAADRLSRVFEPFWQCDDDITRMKPAGTGLGLAISREYVEMLGGVLTVESEPGNGSAFTLVIPELTPE
ncbi:MAG: PAS domain-containing sensor histidine kinase [Coriobacteriia bacterium]